MSARELDAAEANLLELEQRVTEAVGSRFAPQLALLWAQLVVFWPGDEASAEAKRAALSQLDFTNLLMGIEPATQDLLQGALMAQAEGHTQALAQLDVLGVEDKPSMPANLENFQQKARHVKNVVHEQVRKAEQLLRHADTLADAQAGLATAHAGVQRAQGHAATVVNETHNDAITEVSHQVDTVVSVWRAERDACVHCLSYQGAEDTGHGYKPVRKFGKGTPDHADKPPLHPRCRCTQWLLHKSDKAVRDGLKREAERSILRGFSRPSESNKVRIDAARKLLNNGTNLPKSVQDYARRATKKGEFSRGRTPPA